MTKPLEESSIGEVKETPEIWKRLSNHSDVIRPGLRAAGLEFSDLVVAFTAIDRQHWRIEQLEAQNGELLAALKSALQTAEFEQHPFRPWHAEARAAIAKATGKTND